MSRNKVSREAGGAQQQKKTAQEPPPAARPSPPQNAKDAKWTRLVFIMAHILIWFLALDKALELTMVQRHSFGSMGEDDYSLYSSKALFVLWHVWGIIMAGVTSFALWKRHRLLFLIGVLLMLVIQFYPYFTSDRGLPPEELKERLEQAAHPADSSGRSR